MITTRNIRPYEGGIRTIKDRAAHLVQALEGCPLQFTLEALAIFDKYNSPGTKSRSAKRWVRQFCGFESAQSRKDMEAIVAVVAEGRVIKERAVLMELMKDMPDIA